MDRSLQLTIDAALNHCGADNILLHIHGCHVHCTFLRFIGNVKENVNVCVLYWVAA